MKNTIRNYCMIITIAVLLYLVIAVRILTTADNKKKPQPPVPSPQTIVIKNLTIKVPEFTLNAKSGTVKYEKATFIVEEAQENET